MGSRKFRHWLTHEAVRVDVDESLDIGAHRGGAVTIHWTWDQLVSLGGVCKSERVKAVTIIDPACTEAQDRPSHGFNSSISSKDNEVAP